MKHFLLLASVLIAMPAWARTLTPAEALQRAQGDVPAKVAAAQAKSRLVKTGYTAKKQPAYYIFDNSGDNGYMILAADDVAMPVLGYSATGTINPDDMPENLRGWLENYAAEIAWASEREAAGNYISKNLTKETAASQRASWSKIAPLCATKWNQSHPYNLYTPEITYSGEKTKAATGCVATAMAQLMKYHKHPAKGKGKISYAWKKYDDFKNTAEGAPSTDVTMSMDFSTVTFAWDKMLDVYAEGAYSDAQADAVATLMKACGYSVEMSYGPESGAVTGEVANALKTYFGYDSNTRFYSRLYYDIDTWEEMLYNNLKNVGPVQYSGRNDYGGHSFIIDGYAGDGYFHLNWGWGGVSDGDFLITALDPDAQGIGGSLAGYNQNQGAILGAKPAGGSIPKILPFQLAITKAMTPEISGQQLTINSFFGNNGGVGSRVLLAAQFCDYTSDELVATATYGTLANWSASINYGVYQITVTIPSTLPAGTYKVYPVASTNGGSTYTRAIAPIGQPDYVLFQKNAGGTYETEAEYAASVSIENVALNTPVYFGKGFQSTSEAVNNNDTEVLQSVTPAFLINDGGWNIVALCQTQVIDLRAGESMPLTLDLSVIQPSSAYVAGAECYFGYIDLDAGLIISDVIPVTVQAAPTEGEIAGAVNENADLVTFEVANADNVALDDFRINYKVKCIKGYYTNPLYVGVYDIVGNKLSYIGEMRTPICYINAGEWAQATDLKLPLPSGLKVGETYATCLFAANGQISYPIRFKINSMSGIDDIRAEGSDSSVKASLVNGILSVTAGSDIRSIDVYDLSGARVATSTAATADLTGASDGVYVVKVITAEGAASLKLMK